MRKPFIGSSIVFQSGCRSQRLVAPTEKPSATSNQRPYASWPWNHLRKSFASFGFFVYFITACANAV